MTGPRIYFAPDYCRCTEEQDPCPDCGASVANGVCRARFRGPDPNEGYPTIVLIDKTTGKQV